MKYRKKSTPEKEVIERLNQLEKESRISKYIGWGIGVAGILVVIYDVHTSRMIAKESGNFDKGVIQLTVGKYNLSSSKVNNIILTSDNDSLVKTIAAIPVNISNSGDRNINNVTLTFLYPKQNRRIGIDHAEAFGEKAKIGNSTSARIYNKFSDFDQIDYQMKKIQPGSKIEVKETINFVYSDQKKGDDVEVAPNIKLEKFYMPAVVYSSVISVRSDDLQPLRYNVNLYLIKTSNQTRVINHPDLKAKLFSRSSNTLFLGSPTTSKLCKNDNEKDCFLLNSFKGNDVSRVNFYLD